MAGRWGFCGVSMLPLKFTLYYKVLDNANYADIFIG